MMIVQSLVWSCVLNVMRFIRSVRSRVPIKLMGVSQQIKAPLFCFSSGQFSTYLLTSHFVFFFRLFLCRWLYVVEKQIILRYQDFLESNKLPSPSLLIEILLPFNLICMHHARIFLSISKILIRISTSFIIHKEEHSLT